MESCIRDQITPPPKFIGMFGAAASVISAREIVMWTEYKVYYGTKVHAVLLFPSATACLFFCLDNIAPILTPNCLLRAHIIKLPLFLLLCTGASQFYNRFNILRGPSACSPCLCLPPHTRCIHTDHNAHSAGQRQTKVRLANLGLWAKNKYNFMYFLPYFLSFCTVFLQALVSIIKALYDIYVKNKNKSS